VTDSGGFSAAQVILNVSQSTISTQMANLEMRLGVKLCRRGRSGFSLTDDGYIVYEAAKELFQGCESFVSQVNKRRGTVSGELRIALADALIGNPDFPIGIIIQQLRDLMPEVSLVLSNLDPLAIERQILDQRLHGGIHTFPNHAPGLRYVSLFSELQTLYCATEHPLCRAAEDIVSVDEVEQHDYAARTYYGGTLQPGIFHPDTKNAKCTSMEGIAALILSGRFIGHLPTQYASRWVMAGEMKPLLPRQLSYNANFEVVFAAGAQVSRSLEIFEDVLLAEFSNK
jgi:LysR family transcriptional regulator, transcriptional activator for bauABCD operon